MPDKADVRGGGNAVTGKEAVGNAFFKVGIKVVAPDICRSASGKQDKKQQFIHGYKGMPVVLIEC